MKSRPTKNTLDLLLKYEVGGGEEYYNRFLSKFTWPGGASGPTIAIGIDCAYYTEKDLENIFNFLSKQDIDLIKQSVGKTGTKGREFTRVLRKSDIQVSWEKALDIFNNITWPKFCNLTEKTFPGVKDLKGDAYGALVSLVFNRGSSTKGSSRSEMREIQKLVPLKDYNNIASQIRKMKRLWVGKGLDGLIERREAEAKLIESC